MIHITSKANGIYKNSTTKPLGTPTQFQDCPFSGSPFSIQQIHSTKAARRRRFGAFHISTPRLKGRDNENEAYQNGRNTGRTSGLAVVPIYPIRQDHAGAG